MGRFTIRDERGIMKGKVTGHLAANLISQLNGNWRPYTICDDTSSCFEVNEDCVYTIENNTGSLVIYLWEGDILIPE